MRYVGFSTAAVYKKGMPIEGTISFFKSIGADAIELHFATPEELSNFTFTLRVIDRLNEYQYVSVHAPWKERAHKKRRKWREVRYGNDETTRHLVEKLTYVCKYARIKGISIHPNLVDDFSYLQETGLPFLMENMGKKSASYTHPTDFSGMNSKFGFVLDVQHAYEHDPTTKLARKFVESMGNRLKQLHVSGQLSKGDDVIWHSPLSISDNKDVISEFIKSSLKVPIILEGYLFNNYQDLARRELEFVKSL